MLKTQVAGSVPLQLWYSSARNDHMTLASAQGLAYAQANGYTLVTAVLGYVYTNPPSADANSRMAYSQALLANAMN